MPEREKQIKRMADVLKSGGAMLSDLCPECGSPLFKIKDEVWCINCNRQVVIIKEDESISNLDDVERIVLTKLYDNSQHIKNETDPTKLKELGTLVSTWLEVLERLKRLQKQLL